MRFEELMKANKEMLESWKKDENFQDHFCGEDKFIEIYFLDQIQKAVGTKFVVTTKESINDTCVQYHSMMEGYIDE